MLKIVNSREILAKQLPPEHCAVRGLIGEGVFLLAGTPKIGKGFLVLELIAAITTGRDFLGHHCDQGSVLYIALEDRERLIQDRLSRFTQGELDPDKLYYCLATAANLSTGFINEAKEAMAKIPDLRLIVIDTLEKVRGDAKKGQSAYSFDSSTMYQFREILPQDGAMSLLVVHHTSKETKETAQDSINGTNGLAGGSDGNLIFIKNKKEVGYTLHIENRAHPSGEFSLQRENGSPRFKFTGEIERQKEDNLGSLCAELVRASQGKWEGTATELLSELSELAKNEGKKLLHASGHMYSNSTLGAALRENCGALKSSGVIIEVPESRRKNRGIVLKSQDYIYETPKESVGEQGELEAVEQKHDDDFPDFGGVETRGTIRGCRGLP